MHYQHSQASLCKLLFRRSFNGSPKLFSLNSLTTSLAQCVSDSAPLPKPKTPELLLHKPTTNSPHFLHLTFSNSPSQFINRHNLRQFSGGADGFDQNKEVDMINLKFAEAREEIEMAMESKETVYFDEEAECARTAVKEVLDLFDGLLAKSPEDKKAALQRAMGLKIEQLKAELKQLDE
ncbi:unnamed protein product [Prunus armeniaca]|uniref:Uncharacterized protein n=1 Tax=Prunus armeniaca TaxID=36596 RepID=A0A6J5Y5Y8_PRUAR|nr:unnamed protein product [Prunus armeniaca]CAB4319843.1 unnamed protein product [Prunus armeniaca]